MTDEHYLLLLGLIDEAFENNRICWGEYRLAMSHLRSEVEFPENPSDMVSF